MAGAWQTGTALARHASTSARMAARSVACLNTSMAVCQLATPADALLKSRRSALG